MVITENKSKSNQISIIMGIIGALTTFSGLFVDFPQPYFIIGSFLLFLTAAYYKLYFFVALEMIFISGHAAILLGIGTISQIALPVLLSFQLLFYYLFSGQPSDFTIIIAVFGIAIITVGFLINTALVLLLGSSLISIYAYLNLEKSKNISLIWLILNLMFAFVALVRMITA